MSRRHRRHERQDRHERRDRQKRDRRRRDRDRSRDGHTGLDAQPRTSRHTPKRHASHDEPRAPRTSVLQPSDRQQLYVSAGGTTALATIGPGLEPQVSADLSWQPALPRAREIIALGPVLLAVLGLGAAALLTLGLLAGSPAQERGPAGGGVVVRGPGGEVVRQTPDPAAVYTPRPDEGVSVDGQLLFVKSGNVWVAQDRALRRLTDTGRDSTPAWSSDGTRIYLMEARSAPARVVVDGASRRYTLEYPILVAVDSGGEHRSLIKDSLYSVGDDVRERFFTWILQPDVSPDGKTLAVISDWPDPFRRDPTLSLLPVTDGTIRNLDLPAQRPFGHNDPAWSPDGTRIAYTYNDREEDGPSGLQRIVLYSVAEGTTSALTGPGYSQPDWSPDGRFIVCVRGHADGRDLVVIEVATGNEVGRLTRNGASFAPAWSPDGGQIAYLHVDQDGVDLRILTLASLDDLRVTHDKAVTTSSGLDPGSPPTWHASGDVRASPPR